MVAVRFTRYIFVKLQTLQYQPGISHWYENKGNIKANNLKDKIANYVIYGH